MVISTKFIKKSNFHFRVNFSMLVFFLSVKKYFTSISLEIKLKTEQQNLEIFLNKDDVGR